LWDPASLAREIKPGQINPSTYDAEKERMGHREKRRNYFNSILWLQRPGTLRRRAVIALAFSAVRGACASLPLVGNCGHR
jgi:hypothetical protein